MRLFLAPMEGVVDHHLRKIYARIGGIDACVTEFVRVTEHTLPRRVFIRACPELTEAGRRVPDPELGERPALPIRVQLLGSEPEVLALNARKAARLGAIGIDLNFGCPAKTVNRHRGGACLLDETELLYQIVSTVREAVPQEVPVTAKIRLGYMERNSYLENAHALQSAGASELFVHARSKADGYNPPAYWHCIGEIREALKIPVIANGEIWTLEDFRQCRAESGCEDFMLGRGLLANPALAHIIRAENQDAGLVWPIVARLLYDFFIETSKAYPAKFLGNRAKQWLHYLRRHYSEADTLFHQIKRMKHFDELESALREAWAPRAQATMSLGQSG